MKNLVALLLLLIVLTTACTKESNTNNSNTNTNTGQSYISAKKSNVTVMEIATIEVTNLTFDAKIYDATIGGKTVEVGVDSSAAILAFIVPELAGGKYDFKIIVNNIEYKTEFNVSAGILIADPTAFINNSLSEFTFSDNNLDSIYSHIKDAEGSQFSAQHLATIKAYTKAINDSIANMSIDQKKELAAFIAANPDLFSAAQNPIANNIKGYSLKTSGDEALDCPEAILEQTIERARVNKNKLLGLVLIGIGAAPAAPWISAACGLALMYKLYEYNSSNIDGLDRALVRFGEILVADMSSSLKTASVYTFQKDKTYQIKLQSPYRNPDKEDISSTSILMNDMIISLNEIGKMWDKINQFTSKFGYVLEGSAYDLNNVAVAKSKTLAVDPHMLFMTNISNPKVTGKLNFSADGIIVEFTTTEIVNQEFTFDIMYKSKFGESKLTLSATLEVVPAVKTGWYVGKYTLENWFNNPVACAPQAGQTGDIYFYHSINPFRFVFLTRSILEGIPDLYFSDLVWAETYAPGLNKQFELGSYDLDHGVKITNLPTPFGYCTYQIEQGTGCVSSSTYDIKFQYKITYSATYLGEEDPAGLSADEITAIKGQ